MRHYDVVIIGTGPAGQKAAIQAAKLGKHAAIIEKHSAVGGAAINTGTIPSKALREAVLHLTGASKRGLFGEGYRVKRDITVADLIFVSQQVIHHELQVVRSHFDRNGIDLIWGEAKFEDPKCVLVTRPGEKEHVTADKFIVACGTRPALPTSVPFNSKSVFSSDSLLKMDKLPRSMIVVGGGVIGCEYACMMATLGVKVTLVEGRHEVLGFLDREIIEAFQYHMRQMGMTLRMNEKVAKIELIKQPPPAVVAADAPPGPAASIPGGEAEGVPPKGTAEAVALNGNVWNAPLVQATLESGKTLKAQTLLFAVGRQGNTDPLNLAAAGLAADDRGRIPVDEHYRTAVPHIYAVGDVVGFPALASTSMEQGRLAVCHAYGEPTKSIPELFPYGIYAVPEISMVGKTEQQLTEAGIPYEAGIAQYKELARGQLLGDDTGMLKLLIHQETLQILGVHAIGTGSTELIHIGQAVMAFGGTVEFFINNVFNFPTLAEAYKVAALNGLNKLRHI
ncbi:MAG: NAD(P)(+) transhydrogenase (Si-specific) [Phycisphaerae bacterium]|nr:NAD(P)(+) transhydrogenase (Si-specific) [Tepidisphaeraceae bacterium]